MNPDGHENSNLGEQLRFLESIAESANDAIIVTGMRPLDEPGPKVIYANAAFTRLTGYTLPDILGRSPRVLQGPETDREKLDEIRAALEKGASVRTELLNYRKDGSEFWVELDIVPVDSGEGPDYWLSVQRDVTERVQNEKERQESERRLRAVLAQYGSDMITILEPDGTPRYESPAIERTLGYPHRETVGENLFERVHPDDAEKLASSVARCLATPGQSLPLEYRMRHADGSWRYFESIGNNLAEEPNVRGIVVNTRDITERKEAEASLRRSEEHFRTVVESLGEGLVITDAENLITEVNGRLTELTGYAREEMVGQAAHELLSPPDGTEAMRERNRARLESGEHEVYETKIRRKDGSSFWAEINATPYRGASGDDAGTLGAIADITERKKAEVALAEEHNLLRTIIDTAQDFIFVKDTEHRFLLNNVRHREVLGAESQEDALGKTDADFFPEDVADGYHEDDRTLFRTGQTQLGKEENFVDENGERGWISTTKVPLYGASGDIEALVAICRDITDSKRAGEALRESEERFRGAFKDAPVGAALVATDSSFLKVNPALCEIFGYPEEELLAMTSYDVTHPEDHAASEEWMARQQDEGKKSSTIELRFVCKDGSTVWALVSASLVHDGEGEPSHWVCLYQDITGSKLAREALRESEERLQAVTAGAPIILFALDKNGVFTLEQGRGLEELGRTPGALVGRSIFEVLQDYPRIQENVRRAFAGEGLVATVEIGGFAFETRYSPQKADTGEVTGVIGVATDVTERRKLEKELEHRAFHDPLTDLPNRSLFMDRLTHALERAARHPGGVAVLFVDLDGFKKVNDVAGHEAGDRLLISVAGRLKSCLRPEDTVSRLGGDEFVILLENTGIEEANEVAGRISEELRRPFDLGEDAGEVSVTASLGIAHTSETPAEPAKLLHGADSKMYRMKATTRPDL